jgi:hypothetical protein
MFPQAHANLMYRTLFDCVPADREMLFYSQWEQNHRKVDLAFLDNTVC